MTESARRALIGLRDYRCSGMEYRLALLFVYRPDPTRGRPATDPVVAGVTSSVRFVNESING
jgi:hypothetical protein